MTYGQDQYLAFYIAREKGPLPLSFCHFKAPQGNVLIGVKLAIRKSFASTPDVPHFLRDASTMHVQYCHHRRASCVSI